MDCSTMKPTAFRELVRSGRFTGQTSGVCNGYAQANLVILPKDLAFDFLLFATRNPKPCPILDVTEVGNPEPRLAAPGADLRYDIPKYRIYRHGEMAEEVATLEQYWRDDLVAFLLGCSFSFEGPLLDGRAQRSHVYYEPRMHPRRRLPWTNCCFYAPYEDEGRHPCRPGHKPYAQRPWRSHSYGGPCRHRDQGHQSS